MVESSSKKKLSLQLLFQIMPYLEGEEILQLRLLSHKYQDCHDQYRESIESQDHFTATNPAIIAQDQHLFAEIKQLLMNPKLSKKVSKSASPLTCLHVELEWACPTLITVVRPQQIPAAEGEIDKTKHVKL